MTVVIARRVAWKHPVSMDHARILFDDIVHLPTTNIVAPAAAPGHSVDALRYPTTYESYKPLVGDPAAITVTPDTPQEINAILIAGHNLAGQTVSARVRTGAAEWTPWAEVVPVDNSPIMFLFDRAEENRSRFEIRFTGLGIVSVLMAGKALVMERPILEGFAPTAVNRDITLGNQKSIGGQALGFSVLRQGAATQYQWRYLSPSFLTGTGNSPSEFRKFQNYAETGRGFFGVAWRPDYKLAATGNVIGVDGVQYGSLTGPMRSTIVAQPDHYDLNFTVTSAGAIR